MAGLGMFGIGMGAVWGMSQLPLELSLGPPRFKIAAEQRKSVARVSDRIYISIYVQFCSCTLSSVRAVGKRNHF